MGRRRQIPWIHRWSRYLIGGIATAGAALTGYLTIVKLTGNEAACPIKGCDQVLASDYALVFGLPLALFGCLAYLAMAAMALGPTLLKSESQSENRKKLEGLTWNLLFLGGTAMMIFSGYLMYLLATEFKAFCAYCVGSALMSTSLFLLALFGHDWEDAGKLVFNGLIVAMITLVGTVGLYGAGGGGAIANDTPGVYVAQANNNPPPPATTTSGKSELSLAEHLAKTGAIYYGAWWCPHCFDQRQLLGQEAYKKLNYVECSADGANAQPDVCQAAGIQSYPSWKIDGKLLAGAQEPQELATATGYQGPMDFQYTLETIPKTMPEIVPLAQ